MRSIPRKAVVAALTTVAALGASSSAFATGADDIRFDLTAAVNSNQLTTEPKPVNLFVNTTWLDNDGSPQVGGEGAEEVRIDFDDDIILSTKKLPKCLVDPNDLDGMSTAAAIAECGPSQVGAGAAKVRFGAFAGAPFNFEAAEANFTVTAFNGPTSTTGPANCTDDNLGGPFNCEWVGGNPTLYLHAYNQATNQITLVRGEIQDATDVLPGTGTPAIGAGYGQRLAVTDGTDAAGDAGAVSMFNSVVGKNYSYLRNGRRIKASYVKAKCDPADDVDSFVGSPGIQKGFQFKANTVYDDDQSHSANVVDSQDTDTFFSLCGP
ncbi:MAG: hypothetical protein ACR2G3_06100 [Solirubrobacterales bacterium]